jgi:hypothetical protein
MLAHLPPGLLGIVLQSETSWLDYVRNGFIPVAYAVVLLTVIAVVIALVVALFRALGNGDVPKVESWDGFGGGLGGWQVSRSLVLLVGAVLFASLAAVTVRAAATDLKQSPTPESSNLAAADSAAAQQPAPDSASAGADSAKQEARQEPRQEPRPQVRRPPPVTPPSTTTWQ